MAHIPVLVDEVIEGLALSPGSVLMDGTLGEGGHSEAIAKALCGDITIIGIDRDEKSLKVASKRVGNAAKKFIPWLGNFADMDGALKEAGVEKVHGILLDLGWNSGQLESGKGFSFRKNEPLLMTYDADETKVKFSAKDIVNGWDEENIETILQSYGEERFAGRIAKKITEVRVGRPIETTFDLVDIVKSAVPGFYRNRRIHPATKTFQALRMAVNEELQSLERILEKFPNLLKPKGRMAVITFHSLEARIVKTRFRELEQKAVGKLVNKKAILPSRVETLDNPRARSAQLRVFEKV
ncbi:MAG: 16S rRNA (cytosine(1402)-N(4))-methyltransferase RsmH [bacterium]|nr:16S rRNA (cytosine(1402)-N(4))-methyltransferase RsmH [bacterium]